MDRKRLAAALVAVLICLGAASCGFSAKPERELERMLGYLEEGKLSRAERYTVEGTLGIDLRNRNSRKFYSSLFSGMNWSIADCAISGDWAELTLSVTTTSMDALIREASLEALEDSFYGDRVRFYSLLLEKLEADDAEQTTLTGVVILRKTEGKWRVAATEEEFTRLITGGAGELLYLQ